MTTMKTYYHPTYEYPGQASRYVYSCGDFQEGGWVDTEALNGFETEAEAQACIEEIKADIEARGQHQPMFDIDRIPYVSLQDIADCYNEGEDLNHNALIGLIEEGGYDDLTGEQWLICRDRRSGREVRINDNGIAYVTE